MAHFERRCAGQPLIHPITKLPLERIKVCGGVLLTADTSYLLHRGNRPTSLHGHCKACHRAWLAKRTTLLHAAIGDKAFTIQMAFKRAEMKDRKRGIKCPVPPKLPGEEDWGRAVRVASSIPDVCPVFGIMLTWANTEQLSNSASFEHHPDGTWAFISWRANRILLDASSDELAACADYRKQHE